MQGFAQRKDILPSRFGGLHKAIMDDHSLGGYGEEISHGEYTHIAHYIIHYLHIGEESGEARKWWGGHPSFYFL